MRQRWYSWAGLPKVHCDYDHDADGRIENIPSISDSGPNNERRRRHDNVNDAPILQGDPDTSSSSTIPVLGGSLSLSSNRIVPMKNQLRTTPWQPHEVHPPKQQQRRRRRYSSPIAPEPIDTLPSSLGDVLNDYRYHCQHHHHQKHQHHPVSNNQALEEDDDDEEAKEVAPPLSLHIHKMLYTRPKVVTTGPDLGSILHYVAVTTSTSSSSLAFQQLHPHPPPSHACDCHQNRVNSHSSTHPHHMPSSELVIPYEPLR